MIDPVSALVIMAILQGQGRRAPAGPPADGWPPPTTVPKPKGGTPPPPPQGPPPVGTKVPPTPKVKMQAVPAGFTSYQPPPSSVVNEAQTILHTVSVPIGAVVGPHADPSGKYTLVAYRKEPFGASGSHVGVEAFTNHVAAAVAPPPDPGLDNPPDGPPVVTPVDNPPSA